jgi:hypothetical protein
MSNPLRQRGPTPSDRTSPGTLAVFSGHPIDRPGRSTPRFPPAIETRVADALRRVVESLDVRVGYAGGACGSDILFLETMLARGGEVTVVLPYHLARFVADSVRLGSADDRGQTT